MIRGLLRHPASIGAARDRLGTRSGGRTPIYDYEALNNIIGGSGLFVNVARENIVHTSNSFGATFSKELVEAVLGLATGGGALAFASSMVASVGSNGLQISASDSKTNTRSAAIMFICEYLLGMPTISTVVVSIDAKEFTQTVKVGPCFSETTTHTTLNLLKESYIFVPPSYIETCAKGLDFAETSPEYLQLVSWLQDLLIETPLIVQVVQVDGNDVTAVAAGGILQPGINYVIQGQFMPATPTMSARFLGTGTETLAATIKIVTAQPDEISFVVSGGPLDTPHPIGLFAKSSDKPVVITPGGYMVAAPDGSTTPT